MALERELETYNAQKDVLMAHEGKFVVIQGAAVLGTFTSYEDALNEGYRQCKLEPFLVKKIQAIEPVNFFTRSLQGECLTSASN